MSLDVTTLDNGLRVVTDTMDTVETVSVGAWVSVGTRDEAPELNGVSHLLEHMAFKGTKRRSARDIVEEIENVGGHLNAYTSRENTAYFAKVMKEDLPLAIDIIADILQFSTMDQDELERERAVIIQEINQANDTPDDIIFDYFQETAYPDQALGRPVLGSTELIRSMDRQTVIDYMQNQYSASKIVVAAAGRVDHGDFLALVREAFVSLPGDGPDNKETARYKGGEYRDERDLEQVHVLLGFEVVAFGDPDYYPLAVLSTLFGGGMSSRLFQEIREKRGLAYSIYSFASSYSDSGMFGIFAGTGKDEVAELTPVICDEVVKICDGASDDELARARAQLKSSLLMSLESTSARCEHAARQLQIYGRVIPTAEVIERVEAVDGEAVRRVAGRIARGPATIASTGPLEHLEDISKISERLR